MRVPTRKGPVVVISKRNVWGAASLLGVTLVGVTACGGGDDSVQGDASSTRPTTGDPVTDDCRRAEDLVSTAIPLDAAPDISPGSRMDETTASVLVEIVDAIDDYEPETPDVEEVWTRFVTSLTELRDIGQDGGTVPGNLGAELTAASEELIELCGS